VGKVISVTELERDFRTVFDDVVKRRVPYILTRGSRPEAVLVPYEQYMSFVQADEAGVLKRFDQVLARMAVVNAKYPEAEVGADLKQATQVVRSRKRS
jgi:prevent-host-death family protein